MSRGVKERVHAIKTQEACSSRSLDESRPSPKYRFKRAGRFDIASAETAVGPTESPQRETGDEGFTLEQVLGDFGQEERLVERVSLRETIDRLPERERCVIALGLYHSLTQDSTARVMGVSQVQVSRLEKEQWSA